MLGVTTPITNDNYSEIVSKPILLGTASVKYNKNAEQTFKVFVTDTLYDWYEMYKNGPNSCMRFDGANYDFPKQFAWMKKYKLHPMSQLAYNPYIRGFYIKDKNDVTILRSVIFSDREQNKEKFNFDDYKWTASRWYGLDMHLSMDGAAALMSEKIEAAHSIAKEFGINLALHRTKFKSFIKKYTYTIPPLLLNDDKFLIVPYFDNHTANFTLRPNKAASKIIMSVLPDIARNDYTKFRGYISDTYKINKFSWALTLQQAKKLVGTSP